MIDPESSWLLCSSVVPGLKCSVAEKGYLYEIGGSHTVKFNVLGARPIELNVEAIWVDHYPVDLGLSYRTEANISTTSHVWKDIGW